jgi:hypothetical protein
MTPTTTRKPKTITTPEFKVGGPIKATVPGCIVTLEGEQGYYDVSVQVAPCLPMKVGRIYKDGTGWTAFFANDKGAAPSFTGDHFPVRTGKHTQTYALCYLIARTVGFSSSDATYNLQYEGVRA